MLSKQELGGAEIQTRAGGVDDAVDTEEQAFARARRFLSYLPQSVYELPPDDCLGRRSRTPSEEGADQGGAAQPARQVYKMPPHHRGQRRRQGLVLRGQRQFRPPDDRRSGRARLEGRAVLLLAEATPFTMAARGPRRPAEKVVRWADFAETFHLPVVYLMDCPGFMIGLEAEKAAHHPSRRARNGRSQPDHGALVHGDRAQLVRRGRRRASAGGPLPRCATPGRHRPIGARCRWKAASRPAYRAEIDAADDSAAKLKEIEDRLNKLRCAVPFRRKVLQGRGNHRSPQDPLAALRIRAPCAEPAAHAGACDEHDDQAV